MRPGFCGPREVHPVFTANGAYTPCLAPVGGAPRPVFGGPWGVPMVLGCLGEGGGHPVLGGLRGVCPVLGGSWGVRPAPGGPWEMRPVQSQLRTVVNAQGHELGDEAFETPLTTP